ncbi:glutathione S-transferase family protein [Sorangium sp. So ce448]
MILIGQYDSPFVRRVAVALQHYGLAYEHRPWSVWADAESIAKYNPLRRVPVLVTDGGEPLVESAAILDALDDLVGPDRALLPRSGEARRAALPRPRGRARRLSPGRSCGKLTSPRQSLPW